MKLLSEIKTGKGKSLQLLKGDLTDIPNEHRVDVLVVSAFPYDYIPTHTSLIGALYYKGLSVEDLSYNKEIDIRKYSYCWLSKELEYPNIKRILCFEPTERNNPYSLIAGIFQSLMLIAKTNSIKIIAMPLIMTGDQNYSNQLVVNELIETSLLWLESAPFDTIKIVERNDSKLQLLKSTFDNKIATYKKSEDSCEYDFFISYSRKNAEQVNMIKEKLDSKFNIFIDTQNIEVGSNWLNAINKALPKSNRFIVCLSPDYVDSKMCKYEYAFCNLKYIDFGDDYVLPLYLYSAELPFEMSILNYFNAREGDGDKILNFCESIINKYAR
jgi:hypothetical protein